MSPMSSVVAQAPPATALALDVGPRTVSTLALNVFWEFLAREGRDREPLLARLEAQGVPRDQLLQRGGWIAYGTLVVFEQALAEQFPGRPALFHDVGQSIGQGGGLGFLRTVSRLVVSPRFAYQRMPALMHRFLFRFFEAQFEQVDRNRLRGHYRFQEGCPPSDAFLETASGVLAGMPLMFGAPQAEVSLRRLGPLEVEVTLVVDRWPGPWRAFLRLVSAPLRIIGLSRAASLEAAQELEEANRMLQERVEELESLRAGLALAVEERTAELVVARDRLQDTVLQLEASDRARTEFFTNVSHEFKTPLTLILGAVAELRRQLHEAGPDAATDLDRAERAADDLLNLINEVLDFARIDAGRMPLKPSAFDAVAACADLVGELEPLARARGIALQAPTGEVPLLVSLDRGLVLRALRNLVVNAIKYCRPGDHVWLEVAVSVDAAAASGAAPPLVSMAVADDGPGIAEAEQRKIFGRFQRAADADGAPIAGSGIGLAMVSDIATLHGGRLTLHSEQGRGARFTMTLPVDVEAEGAGLPRPDPGAQEAHGQGPMELAAPTHSPLAAEILPPAPNAPRLQPSPAHRGCVLVVDDNDELRSWMARLLERHHRVLRARNGQEALAIVREAHPDVVVSDVMMPVLDGLALTRAIKGDPELQRCAVILVTARHGAGAVVEGLEARADDFVAKPFAAEELLARVQTQLRLRDLQQTLVRSEKGQLLGTLAAGMAHEILNPVNALLQSVRLLRQPAVVADLSDDERLELLSAIDRCGVRVMNIVKSVQAFARHEAPTSRMLSVSLAERLDALRPLLLHRLGEVELKFELGFDGPLPWYPDLLDQALMNLLVNAIDAAQAAQMATPSEARQRAILRSSVHENEVHIAVSDSGAGVPAAERERIFQPFYTTKDPGKGTGLGLSIAREIAQLHGGRLELDRDAPEGGACFRLSIPQRSQKTGESIAEADSPPAHDKDGLSA